MASLIERIKDRIADPRHATEGAEAIMPTVAAPATAAQVDAAEAALGFTIPPLLRRLYIEVGNGGFGPGYGLIGVPTKETAARRQRFIENYYRNIQRPRGDPNWWPAELVPVGDFDIVETYRRHAQEDPNDPAWQWPARLVPVCHLGCGMYECVDFSNPQGPVVWFEPNPREKGDPLADFLIFLALSLERRLEAWLAGENLTEAAFEESVLKRRLER
jgi:hypothetical protein